MASADSTHTERFEMARKVISGQIFESDSDLHIAVARAYKKIKEPQSGFLFGEEAMAAKYILRNHTSHVITVN